MIKQFHAFKPKAWWLNNNTNSEEEKTNHASSFTHKMKSCHETNLFQKLYSSRLHEKKQVNIKHKEVSDE